MKKNEIIEFLKENLKLEYEVTGSTYGSNTYREVKLLLCGEEISSIYMDDLSNG